MMVSPRRLSFLSASAIVGVAVICAVIGSGGGQPDDSRQRAHAATIQLDSLAAREPDSVRALSLAYLERARLGLGDPFRLVDEATHDPRLNDATGSTVAWAILDRVFKHSTYEIDASVLDAVGPRNAGADHLALIERVIRRASSPRVGETTVRLAYALAAAQGSISSSAPHAVLDAAALLRDRVLAEGDLTRAVRSAGDNGSPLLDEVTRLRAGRELSVERPLLIALSRAEQDEAIAAVPAVLADIETIQPDSSAVTLPSRSLIPLRLAPIVARLGARRPPSAATRVTLQTRTALLESDQ